MEVITRKTFRKLKVYSADSVEQAEAIVKYLKGKPLADDQTFATPNSLTTSCSNGRKWKTSRTTTADGTMASAGIGKFTKNSPEGAHGLPGRLCKRL